jgi:hypothetical protein
MVPQLACLAALEREDCCVLLFSFRTRRPDPTFTPIVSGVGAEAMLFALLTGRDG